MANIFFVTLILSVLLLNNVSLLKAQQQTPQSSKVHSKSLEDRPAEFRLNDTFIPSNYDIELKFPVENAFEGIEDQEPPGARQGSSSRLGAKGKVKILGVAKVERKYIDFFTTHLHVIDATMKVARAKNPTHLVKVAKVHHGREGFIRIELEEEMQAGEEILLEMDFIVGIVDCAWAWVSPFCSAKYETDTGEIRQFFLSYPNHFTRIFPCFNEPHLTATYDMTIVRRPGQKSLFNSELVSSTPEPVHQGKKSWFAQMTSFLWQDEGWVRDKFARTMILPPSAIAVFLASHFDAAEAKFGNKTARVHLPDFSAQRLGINDTALKVANILSAYEELLDKSRVAKLDLVVVPAKSVGWRTWGLNVYETQSSFKELDFPYNAEIKINNDDSGGGGAWFDEKIAKPLYPNEDGLDGYRETNRLAVILAQQWFASMWSENEQSYWTEPIQRFLHYVAMEYLEEDNVGKEALLLRDVQVSMEKDAAPDAVPFSEQDSVGFGDIAVNRGGPLLRMVDNFLTRPTMKKALQSYLDKVNKKVGASPKDFFDSLEEAAKADKLDSLPSSMGEIMETWTDQSGFPLVKIDVVNKTHIGFSQQRFVKKEEGDSEGEERGKEEVNGTWYIPVTFVTQDEPSNVRTIWLGTDNKTKTVEHDVTKWIIVNPNATGYFRTLYDDNLFDLLVSAMAKLSFVNNSMTTSQLLNDYVSLSQGEYVGAQAPFNLTRYLGRESHLGVWGSSNLVKAFAPNGLLHHPNASVLSNYIDARVGKVLSNIGSDESNKNPSSGKLLRRSLLKLACSHQLQSCAPSAKKLFEEWKANPASLTFDHKDGPECGVVSFGGQEAFDFVFQKYKDNLRISPADEILASALACAMESQVIEGFLNKTLSPREFGFESDSFEFASAFSELYEFFGERPKVQKRVIPFLTSRFKQAEEALGSLRVVSKMVRVIGEMAAEGISTREQVDEAKAFRKLFEDRMADEEKEKSKNDFNRMEETILWMDRVGNDIISYASLG